MVNKKFKSLDEIMKERELKLNSILEAMKKNYPAVRKHYNEKKKDMEWEEIDGIYRIYHHSFKMYNEIQGYILNCLNLVGQLIGKEKIAEEEYSQKIHLNPKKVEEFLTKIYSNRLEYLEALDFDYYFTRTLRNALKLRWSPDRNRTETWYKDQSKLCAAAWHSKLALESFMEVAKSYKKTGKFSNQVIDEKEANFLSILGLR